MKQTHNWRFYAFTNFYLSSMQKGIQAGHCAVDVVRAFSSTKAVREWADKDKTMIVLNGGEQTELLKLFDQLTELNKSNKLPLGLFKEDMGLNCAVTCVGIIVPERIYAPDMLFYTMNNFHRDLTATEVELWAILRSRPLAI